MKKAICVAMLFLCSTLFTNAQFYKKVIPNDGFNDSLSRIVFDFKTNFYPIQGKQLTSQGLVDVYESKAGMPGATHCIIQRYHSEEDTTASWQAIMYEGESYDEAVKIYKHTYKQLKKAKIKNGVNSPYSFVGELEAPEETVRFTVTPMKLNASDTDFEYFFAEVEITNSAYDAWEVHLNLHSKKKDTEKY